MADNQWLQKHAALTLDRLLSRIEPLFVDSNKQRKDIFFKRLNENFFDIFRLLHTLYGDQYDFFYHIEKILAATAKLYLKRPPELHKLDNKRESDPLWFQSEKMMGAVCYVDLFAGDLAELRNKIPYFEELGLTYLHLMPLFKAPEKESDGGYAVSDYRIVNPKLGTMQQLAGLAAELRQHGISLVLDFVFNHTSNEHPWALKALAGDEQYQDFYHMFDDRTIPDQYEKTLREIFPQQDPGNFTYIESLRKWVWTSFRSFQWDLKYKNPAVFTAMLEELLFLANQGVEFLRLDAVAFIWKQMGTSSENMPQAHQIIQAYNALVKVAAPAMLFKSEAIVHPADVAKFISWEECPVSYNPTMMALLWESLATREVKLLRHSMTRRFDIPDRCAWVNYVRVHDDIGWTFADEDAAEVGVNGYDHRLFLNLFYSGKFEGTFAKGLPFNYNPINQDMRISGTTASLAGLENGIELKDKGYIEDALKRILLIHSVILSAGGIPLLYLGDEIATLNDYSYEDDPNKKVDSRWAHRPKFDWERAEKRSDETTYEGRIFQNLIKLIQIRKKTPAFAVGKTQFFDTGNPHILGYLCNHHVMVLANFSESKQAVNRDLLNAYAALPDEVVDLAVGKKTKLENQIELAGYQFRWLRYQID